MNESRAPGVVQKLAQQLQQWQTSQHKSQLPVVSSGVGPLDQLLPEEGYRRGSLVEWIASATGCGATTLALHTAKQALKEGGALVVVDRAQQFSPLAACLFDLPLEKWVILRPRSDQEELWALDQSLRCQGVAAVLAWVDELSPRDFRRLQLSAEQGENLGLLLRPARASNQPTWAEIRWRVEPRPRAFSPSTSILGHRTKSARRLRATLVRSRTSLTGRAVELEIEDATGRVHLVPPLVSATTRACPTGA